MGLSKKGEGSTLYNHWRQSPIGDLNPIRILFGFFDQDAKNQEPKDKTSKSNIPEQKRKRP